MRHAGPPLPISLTPSGAKASIQPVLGAVVIRSVVDDDDLALGVEGPEDASDPLDSVPRRDDDGGLHCEAFRTTSATPAPPAATPEPSATSVAGDPKLELGDPTWRDTFNNSDSWPIYDDEHVQMSVQDSSLQMTLLNADKWNSWVLTTPILRNFYLEVTVKPGDCADNDNYGLLARAPSETEAYLFGFTCDGKYSFRRWTGERFATNVDWTASEYILSGKNQTNHLGLMAKGTSFSLYANGHLLTELHDANYLRGGIGLYASAFKTANFLVRFQEVQYWELP